MIMKSKTLAFPNLQMLFSHLRVTYVTQMTAHARTLFTDIYIILQRHKFLVMRNEKA